MTLLGPAGDPQSPPKLVRPFQEVETFDRNVSDKIHKNLVTTRLHSSSKGKPEVTKARHHMSESKTLIRPLLANDVIVASMNAKTDSILKVTTTTPTISREANDDAMIVSGTREKRRILEAYEKNLERDIPIR